MNARQPQTTGVDEMMTRGRIKAIESMHARGPSAEMSHHRTSELLVEIHRLRAVLMAIAEGASPTPRSPTAMELRRRAIDALVEPEMGTPDFVCGQKDTDGSRSRFSPRTNPTARSTASWPTPTRASFGTRPATSSTPSTGLSVRMATSMGSPVRFNGSQTNRKEARP